MTFGEIIVNNSKTVPTPPRGQSLWGVVRSLGGIHPRRGVQIIPCGKHLLLHTDHEIRRMCSGCRRTVNGILLNSTQERIAIGSSNLLEGLTMWPAMYDH